MRRSSRRLLRLLVAPAVAATVALAGALAVGGPVAAQEDIFDPTSQTDLVVDPADRTLPGVELSLTAEVVDSASEPVVGEDVRFSLDGVQIAQVTLDASGRAHATVTPPQGAHWIEVSYAGRNDLMPSFAGQWHSVLPATCVDEAQPGAGAVVRHAYLVALRRCPDPGGFAYWVGRLDAGAEDGAVAAALARSSEALGVVVDDAYRRILDRPADAAGRQVWMDKLRSGWTTSQLWAALAASPELAAGTSDTAGLVAKAFARIVGRPVDPTGAAYWQQRLATGGLRSSTWRALAVTAEVVDGIVAEAHRTTLGRAATMAERDAARAAIRSRRGDWRPLVSELLGRPEASTHAQRYPDPVVDG